MAKGAAKRFFGSVIFIIAVFLFLGFLFLLFADTENLELPFVDQFDTVAKVVGMMLSLIALLLTITVLARAGKKKEDEELFFIPEEHKIELAYSETDWPEEYDDAPGEGIDVQVYHLPSATRQQHAWKKTQRRGIWEYYFPREVEHALYINDYVNIDPAGRRVLMRTLVAGPQGGSTGDVPKARKTYMERLIKEDEEKKADEQARREADQVVSQGPGDGKDFMRKLEQRATESSGDEPETREEVYYGYGGGDASVDTVPGISDVAALRDNGIETVGRLCWEDPGRLAQKLGIRATEVSRWQNAAEFMQIPGMQPEFAEALAELGIDGISGLRRRAPSTIAKDVNAALDGTRVTDTRVDGWQRAAKEMRRTKQRVPAA